MGQGVGEHASHEAPEAEVVVGRRAEDGLVLAAYVLHHPDVHHGAVAEAGESADEDAHKEERIVGGEARGCPHQDCDQQQAQHRASPSKPDNQFEHINIFVYVGLLSSPVTDKAAGEDSSHESKKGDLLLELPQIISLQNEDDSYRDNVNSKERSAKSDDNIKSNLFILTFVRLSCRF